MNFFSIAEYIMGLLSIYAFVNTFFKIKSYRMFAVFSIIIPAVSSLIYFLIDIRSNFGISAIVLFLGLTFLPCTIKGVKKYYLLFTSVLFSGIIFFISSIFPLVMSIIDKTLDSQTDRFLTFLSNVFAMVIFIVLMTLLKSETRTFILAVSKITIVLITAFLYIGGFLNLLGTIIDSSQDYKIIILKITILLVSFIFTISIPVLSYNQIKKNQYMYKNKLYEQQLNAQLDYYQSIAKSGYELRKLRHDYNNLSIGMKSLIKDNRHNDALQLLDKYDNQIISSFNILYNTGCDIADAILTDKQQKANENIKITFEGNLKNITTDNLDICVLLNNTLDIAVILSENCDSSAKQHIAVKSTFIRKFLFYEITAPINDNIGKEREEATEHNPAFCTLQSLVKKNDGIMETSCIDNRFRINIKYAC
ncbi:MAG: hypothetical protein UHD05_04875 [Ruminococcus sp.]|nr:hypothetical protein [Ruminococcus sp.]